MDNEAGMTFTWTPESPVENGYMGLAITKIWMDKEYSKGANKRKKGVTLEMPYGKEQLIAIPLDEELGECPEGMVTLEALQKALEELMENI